MSTFIINENLLEALDEYDRKSRMMELHSNIGLPYEGDLQKDVDDDLIFSVPIYDTAHRRYASFCSFTEAVWHKELDIRGMGKHFRNTKITEEFDWFMLFYLFRLCGSGINYVPRKSIKNLEDILGTHGFGNFWIVNSILNNRFTWKEWKEDLKNLNGSFTNNKGYLLPQFTFAGQTNGHLKKFILEHAEDLVRKVYDKVTKSRYEIFQVSDSGNYHLKNLNFKRQNFVLTAFAADISEYFPKYVDPKGSVYAGTNATKCINAIFPRVRGKNKSLNEFDYINDVLKFLSDRYKLNPIDCEDSRACDLVRYFQEYQSADHIETNNGKKMLNNSILKKRLGVDKYYEFSNNLK